MGKRILRMKAKGGPFVLLTCQPRQHCLKRGHPLSNLVGVVRGDLQRSGLSSLEVNLTVTEILDAERESAATGKRIDLPAGDFASY
jgi:hypothetical protein